MISKKQQLLNAITTNNISLALSIAKNFQINFNADQRRILQIAHESQDPRKANFYASLGLNVSETQTQAQQLLQQFQISKMEIR